jgi:hypothetical protein
MLRCRAVAAVAVLGLLLGIAGGSSPEVRAFPVAPIASVASSQDGFVAAIARFTRIDPRLFVTNTMGRSGGRWIHPALRTAHFRHDEIGPEVSTSLFGVPSRMEVLLFNNVQDLQVTTDSADVSMPSELASTASSLRGIAGSVGSAFVVAGIQRDTDVLFRALPFGVSIYVLFGSARAPERIEFQTNALCPTTGFQLFRRLEPGTFSYEQETGEQGDEEDECEPFSHTPVAEIRPPSPTDTRAAYRAESQLLATADRQAHRDQSIVMFAIRGYPAHDAAGREVLTEVARQHERAGHSCPPKRGSPALSGAHAPRRGDLAVTLICAKRRLAGRAATTVVLLAMPVWVFVQAPSALGEAAPLTLEAPFGEHDGLRIVDDAVGTSALAWRITNGEGQRIEVAEVASGAAEASPPESVVAGSRTLSEPALAISPAGRVAVAWFEQREDAHVWGEDALAVKVRERAPDGTWEPPRTLWRAPTGPPYASDSLVVAVDDAGDAAVLWTIERVRTADSKPLQLLAATRATGGGYRAPAILDGEAAATQPAVAIAPDGEVTALWVTPWRTAAETLNAETWRTGSPPGAGVVSLDRAEGQANGIDPPLGHLSLRTALSGEQLAAWLNGGPGRSGRPDLVGLRAAWKSPSGTFEPAQAVSPAGVEAREPALALSSTGRAVLAWSEIAADGSGPLLNYATATAGAPITAGSPVSLPGSEGLTSGEANLAATWLPGGRVLLTWIAGHTEVAQELTRGMAPAPRGTPIRTMQEDLSSLERPVIAGGEGGRPALAWVGRSPADFSTNALRYVIGANLPAFAGAASPSASLVGRRDVLLRGVAVHVVCPEACTATATGAAYALRSEDPENPAGPAFAKLGGLTGGHVSLPAAGGRLLRLRLVGKTRKRFCGTARHQDVEAIEVTITTRTAAAGERHLVLGEEPTSKGCRR